jgi:hypothetical protein
MFRKGQISDVEQKRRFLARLRPEIRKLCMVRVFADIEELVAIAIEVERVLGELGETPFEPLKEEQEEGTEDNTIFFNLSFFLTCFYYFQHHIHK